ncbi:type I-E CRISPR-associated protein Cse2/CasB [Pelotalea chapellei]|uniref:Type I-E CRISPR-associated protein Cse2/CasB n=1 Tax=Pelotalea chapellei TaxID=44671 RepID=A0ABS5U513_9BACT|nr:type I-E CRISPR-associated protein Cse2/CasB [Pelotalea chapellei]MBT1070734.1 type I-E CRISPR-associated protein Cse2/CasB [Pelotalea chapellei]
MSRLLERLRKCQDDRGMMANLRCILVANKKHRAWPALNRLDVAIDKEIPAFIAGLFASHPEGDSSSISNFGETCKRIEKARGEETSDFSSNAEGTRKKNLTSTERRFQHLLAANKGEIQDRVKRMVLMAKSQGVAVNYAKLLHDLEYWGDRTKTEWAASFWTPGTEPVDEEGV